MSLSPMPHSDISVNPLDVRPIAGSIGAEIHGLDLSSPLSAEVFDQIHAAFLDHLVLFFPHQSPLTPANLSAFASRFGEVDKAPFVYPFKVPSEPGFPEVYNNIKEAGSRTTNIGGFWHADVTYRVRPHLCSVLYAKDVPTFGGDTMFANQYLAYETLPDDVKERVSKMKAVHSSTMIHGQSAPRIASVSRDHIPNAGDESIETHKDHVIKGEPNVVENLHPVVRVHPDTGRKLLYVNRGFTSRFDSMSVDDSLPLLEYLWHHATRAEFTCRYRWRPHDVTVWDNRAVHHYAINDYFGHARHMQRIAVHEPVRPY